MTKMMQIVNKLGWSDIPADITLDAVQRGNYYSDDGWNAFQ